MGVLAELVLLRTPTFCLRTLQLERLPPDDSAAACAVMAADGVAAAAAGVDGRQTAVAPVHYRVTGVMPEGIGEGHSPEP